MCVTTRSMEEGISSGCGHMGKGSGHKCGVNSHGGSVTMVVVAFPVGVATREGGVAMNVCE